MTEITIKQLFIHPIKGLTPQECDRVFLKAGHGIPGDRAYALMYNDAGDISQIETTTLPWMSKKNFAVQNDWPGLASLNCQYNPENQLLTISNNNQELLAANTNTTVGRDLIGTFFTGYLAALFPTEKARHPQQTSLHLVGNNSGETRYPDREPVHISLLAQATLDQLSDICNYPIDARRFRPNIVLTGIPAWSEFNLIGKELQIGSAKIIIEARIGRCLNIEVNPDTGKRDIPLFSLLQQHFGHAQTGILAKVITDGNIAVGNIINVINTD